ncbi:MAG: ABC transporter ATP-binding protein [bacterium TMED144]|nr:MAG: ABC transporter ATP-binding protein [bacterium TMED144]|tara:strand:+ start:420 stop:1109 length:690 start_codon:yes stop_codon:yes gene_type:complete
MTEISLIAARNIYKSYGNGNNILPVLKKISFEIKEKDFVTVVGPSGIGKSTLLNIIGTLDKPDSGSIQFDGLDLSKFSDNQLSDLRLNMIGFIFQFHHLIPEFNVIDNVIMPNLIAEKKPNYSMAKDLLDHVQIVDKINSFPSQLSGGEKARVSVARALMNNPKIILADEPTGNLDAENAERLIDLLLKVREEFDQTIVLSTHNKKLSKLGNKKFEITKNQFKIRDRFK